MGGKSSKTPLPPLKAVSCVDAARFCGDWWVVGCIPTPFEVQPHNARERYTPQYRKGGKEGEIERIDVDFTYQKKEFGGKESTIKQWLYPDPVGGGMWKAQPRICGIPLVKMDYVILDVAEDYSHTVVGVTDRAYVWVMSRTVIMDEAKLDALKGDLVTKHGYDLKDFIAVHNEPRLAP
eukprot:Hpha_TRINITY_DN14987_c0_g1::TRINITY_DN14987_c0_g1_i2::g.144846::m.144846/K03098/APOD; apolipoprotein D and lipocalin family protein